MLKDNSKVFLLPIITVFILYLIFVFTSLNNDQLNNSLKTVSSTVSTPFLIFVLTSLLLPQIFAYRAIINFQSQNFKAGMILLITISSSSIYTLNFNNTLSVISLGSIAYLVSACLLLLSNYLIAIHATLNQDKWLFYPFVSLLVFVLSTTTLTWALSLPINLQNMTSLCIALLVAIIFLTYIFDQKKPSAFQMTIFTLNLFYLIVLSLEPETFTIYIAISAGIISLSIYAIISRTFMEEKYKELSSDIEKERRLVKQELHDGILNDLVSISVTNNGLKRITDKGNDKISSRLATIDELTMTMSKRMRSLLNISNSNQISWTDFFQQLVDYMTHILESSAINFSTYIDSNIPTKLTAKPEVCINLELVLRELIINILKHSNASRVSFSVIFKNSSFYITIENNGFSSPSNSATQETGHGKTNISNRLDSVHAKINNWINEQGNYVSLITFNTI